MSTLVKTTIFYASVEDFAAINAVYARFMPDPPPARSAPANVALHLQADDAELTRRLLARAALEHRSDDTAEVIAQRLVLYHEVTSPIIAWYRDRGILVSVDAMRSAAEVGREILVALEAMRPLLNHVPADERLPLDLTGLGEAFGAAGPGAGVSQ